jgi:hypothetical protein
MFSDTTTLSTRFRPLSLIHFCIIIIIMLMPIYYNLLSQDDRGRAVCWTNEKWLFDLESGNEVFLLKISS